VAASPHATSSLTASAGSGLVAGPETIMVPNIAKSECLHREPAGLSRGMTHGAAHKIIPSQPRKAAMSTTEDRSSDTSGMLSTGRVDMKLEVIVIPVSDVVRAKEFCAGLGWRLDADRAGDDFRLIQFTPPGSGCSVQFGTNLTDPDWPDWYAAYMVAEQAGTELPR
jgi:hypothetical protein